MKANELMIRNVVFDPDRSEQDFEGLGKGIYRVSAHTIERFDAGWMKLEPVELTREWLERFGFKRQNNAWNGPHGNDFSIWNPIGSHVFTLNDTVFCPEIDYCHQLQNVYFSMTGRELELKK